VERLLWLAATGTDKESKEGGGVKLPPPLLGQLYFSCERSVAIPAAKFQIPISRL
jgi:hypothetical protein